MPLTISDKDFKRLYQFIQANFGINLSQKQQLISSRLSSTVEARGFTDFGPFVDKLLKERNPQDLELVLNKLTTNYTFFMRETEHFQFFQNTILPDLVRRHQRDKVLSIWSAGCSSGEEPYNISIYIKEFLGPQAKDWDTRILATDISQNVLAKAKQGTYELPDAIPADWKRKYFVRSKGNLYSVAPILRDNVIFQTFNLMDPIRFKRKFDVIFCRNVMIYFDQSTKDALVNRFHEATVPGGYLLIGHSENLSKNAPYVTLAPSTFQKRR
jgi:chemotaxis protein methyltransferase CheR